MSQLLLLPQQKQGLEADAGPVLTKVKSQDSVLGQDNSIVDPTFVVISCS